MTPRRAVYFLLSFLALFLLGTVLVLSSITYYLAIDPSAYLTELEVPILDNLTRWNAVDHGQVERVPRILHQTWKSDSLPLRWKDISQHCRNMMPDYEYMLWTDESSRKFITDNYPWFLDTFDDYPYAIQRADAIRYFVLHHYGGVYLDLDIGCLRPLDPLLIYPVILPKTIPVGVSNDLLFSEKGHPFFAQTIHNLVTFDHSWILNYPTVMFSTGPMFLSAQYGLFTSSHPAPPAGQVRILPKSLYGKNAKKGEAPHSFFSHYYGSSWHADDAAFIGFLGTWGKGLMWLGLIILILGVARIAWPSKSRGYNLRRIGGYEILLPRWPQRTDRWQPHRRWSSSSSGISAQSPSPSGSDPDSPLDVDIPVLHLPLNVRPTSPSAYDMSTSTDQFAPFTPMTPLFDAVRRVRNRVASIAGVREEPLRTPIRNRRRPYSRGVLFFLPAIFAHSQDVELPSSSSFLNPRISDPPPPRSVPRPLQLPSEKQRYAVDLERAGVPGDVPAQTDLSDPGVSDSNLTPESGERLVDIVDSTRRQLRSTSSSRNASHSRTS